MTIAKNIYLDYAAATPMDERVVASMMPYLSDLFYNPSSPYAPAVAVRRDYEAAKSRLAASFGARGDELVITAGATESINLAFASTSGHVVSSSIEHDAVLAVVRTKDYTIVPCSEKGIVSEQAVKTAIRPDTGLVSVQLANNEMGTIQPIRAIAGVVEAERAKRLLEGNKLPIIFHCDASQGFGLIDIHTARLGIDLLTLNSAKVYGPKQVGLLWIKPGTVMAPFVLGGGQERGLRSGTENVAGTIGFAKAAELASKHRASEATRLAEVRDAMQKVVAATFDHAVFSGNQKKRLPASLHFSIAGIDAERIVFMLERKGIFLATGSACAANKGSQSHVLSAIGLNESLIQGSLRITLGRFSNKSECLEAAEEICRTIKSELMRVGVDA